MTPELEQILAKADPKQREAILSYVFEPALWPTEYTQCAACGKYEDVKRGSHSTKLQAAVSLCKGCYMKRRNRNDG